MRYFDEVSLIVLAMVLFLVATNTQTGWLFVVCAAMLGCLVVSFWLSRRQLRTPTLTVAVPGRLRVGEENALRFQMRGLDGLSYPVLVELPEQGFEASGPPPKKKRRVQPEDSRWGQGRTFTLPVHPRKRGPVPELQCCLHCLGPFGWFAARKPLRLACDALVLPRAYPLTADLLDLAAGTDREARGLAREGGRRASAQGDLSRLRSYQAGEDIRRVHWATSARANTLMVMEFSEDPRQGLVILLDNAGGHEKPSGQDTNFEELIRWAAGFVEACQQSQRGFTLRSQQGTCQEPPLEWLARLQCDGAREELEDWGGSAVWLSVRPIPAGAVGELALGVEFASDLAEGAVERLGPRHLRVGPNAWEKLAQRLC